MGKALYTEDEKIEKKTEKSIEEWKKLIDKSKAAKKGHTAIKEYLCKKEKLQEVWAEAIAIRYERDKFLK